MNTIYYLITRKIIRPFFINLKMLWVSLFYMSLVVILSTILSIVFRNQWFFTPAPTALGIIVLIYLLILCILFIGRIIKQIDTYALSDEPEFLQQFIKDCCRPDNKLEEKYQQAKEAKREVIRKKIEKKKLEVERIEYRSEILDL